MQPPGTPQRARNLSWGDTAKPNPARWFQTRHKVASQFTQYLIVDIGDHHIKLLCQLVQRCWSEMGYVCDFVAPR